MSIATSDTVSCGRATQQGECYPDANHHIRLEEHSVIPFMQQLQQRYIDSEIAIEDIATELNAKYKVS